MSAAGPAPTLAGRILSQDLRLQNIPLRTPLGKLIRQALVPSPDPLLASVDYSQIELRILAQVLEAQRGAS